MADDLEQLLDEVERRLCRLPGRGAAGGHRHGGGLEEEAAKESRSAKLLLSSGSSEEDIDDIIDEICNDSSFAKTPLKLKSNSASLTPESNSVVAQAHRKRCCPVYLGGSSSPCGIGTNISKRTCDQLRCTACDFRVSLFNDYIWDQSCDYLFFRNNMPELSKLRAKMIKKKGARAYACQCSWRSIDELTDLQTEQQLRQDESLRLSFCLSDVLGNFLACSIGLWQVPQENKSADSSLWKVFCKRRPLEAAACRKMARFSCVS